jgi:hypothetical protein
VEPLSRAGHALGDQGIPDALLIYGEKLHMGIPKIVGTKGFGD